MSEQTAKTSHIERTAAEPRAEGLQSVVLTKVVEVNDRVRLFQLELQPGESINFLPGQWVDLFVPGIVKPGGFTITSPPSRASSAASPAYIELAIQQSPENPPAAWLWRPIDDITNATLRVRVGGRFVWPPPSPSPSIHLSTVKRALFVAGGVGINPLMSMLSHLAEASCQLHIELLYSTKVPASDGGPADILFLQRLTDIFRGPNVNGRLRLFLTGTSGDVDSDEGHVHIGHERIAFVRGRIRMSDLSISLGPLEDRAATVVYVCGVPSMTDECIELLLSQPINMDEGRIFCEKWW